MPMPAPSSSQRSFACSIVLTQARSAAYIGCSGSMASGIPAGRAYSRNSPMPSRTISRAPARSFDAILPSPSLGSPPTTSTRHGAPSVQRLVDGALVVVERRASSRAISGRKHAAATVARQAQTRIANALRRFLETRRGNLITPRRDKADATARAAGDDLGQRPLLAHGRCVDRQQLRVGGVHRWTPAVSALCPGRATRAACACARRRDPGRRARRQRRPAGTARPGASGYARSVARRP